MNPNRTVWSGVHIKLDKSQSARAVVNGMIRDLDVEYIIVNETENSTEKLAEVLFVATNPEMELLRNRYFTQY